MGVRSSKVRKEHRSGKLRLIIDFRYVDKDGRRRRYRRDATLQTAAGARAEAERLLLQVLTTGTLETRSEAPTFADFVEGPFTRIHMPARCRPATRERYEALFAQGILERFGSKRLDRIGVPEIRAFEATLVERGVQARPHVSLVRTVLRAAVELGALEKLGDLPPLPKRGRKVPDAPTDEEVAQLLERARGWLRPAIALAAYAGLRMGEIRALEVRDVDLNQRVAEVMARGDSVTVVPVGKEVNRGRIVVRRAISGDEVLPPKSGHERIVPLAPGLQAILGDALRRKLPTARVILNARGRTPTRQSVLSKLKALQARCDLPIRSFHSLRHYFCTTLIRNGASAEAVRVLAGHHGLDVTQRYVHVNATDLQAAITKLRGN